MRGLLFFIFALAASLPAGEPTSAPAWPLWDGQESVEQYAQRVNLPPTQTLDLGNNVTLELVLIPAGQFIMGTPEPPPVNEDGFRKKIIVGQALLAASAGALLIMLLVVTLRAVRETPAANIVEVAVIGDGCGGGMRAERAALAGGGAGEGAGESGV